jgi:hypothetical protein
MSSSTRRHEFFASFKLILCIAAGIWLGVIAVALTGLLLYKSLPAARSQALDRAVEQFAAPEAAAPAQEPDTAMFRKYEQSLRESEARQAQEQLQEQRQRTYSRSKCDFWMQQDRTAPSEKSRANVDLYCG